MTPRKPKVGVLIPCIAEHIEYLPVLLARLACGTVEPHRIAIVISNLGDKPAPEVSSRIVLRKYKELVETGPAKQMAYEMLDDCDVICYQDADDDPTPDRVQFIRDTFSNHHVQALNHSYYTDLATAGVIERGLLIHGVWKEYFPTRKIELATNHKSFGDILPFPIHAGAISVRRNVLRRIKWRPFSDLPLYPKDLDPTKGDDWHFCFECLYALKGAHYFSDAVLYRYRVH